MHTHNDTNKYNKMQNNTRQYNRAYFKSSIIKFMEKNNHKLV